MPPPSFSDFQSAHPAYARAFAYLSEHSPALARSAETVFETQGRKLGKLADDILGFMDATEPGGPDAYMARYTARVHDLIAMQERFNLAPSLETLGDPDARVDRESYNAALLLSILFSNHRFEIIASLRNYLDMIRAPAGRAAAVGMGTGFELKLMADKLRGWTLEGYDIDLETHATARNLLQHFGVESDIKFGEYFPLDRPDANLEHAFDGLILSEVLEHLPDPATALVHCARYLKPSGYLFATMAVNLAQEDHIFLYPDAESCREQLRTAGLKIVYEFIAPVIVAPLDKNATSADREAMLGSGNYIAIAARA